MILSKKSKDFLLPSNKEANCGMIRTNKSRYMFSLASLNPFSQTTIVGQILFLLHVNEQSRDCWKCRPKLFLRYVFEICRLRSRRGNSRLRTVCIHQTCLPNVVPTNCCFPRLEWLSKVEVLYNNTRFEA